MVGSAKFELEIGFDLETSADEARDAARERWTDALARAGKRAAGPVDVYLTSSPGLSRIGQFSIIVSGLAVDDQ